MDLEWDAMACSQPIPQDADEARFRSDLIFAALELGLGTVSEENIDEWMFRLYHPSRLASNFTVINREITPEQMEPRLRRWIGLTTNIPTQPREKWLAALKRQVRRRAREASVDDETQE